MFLSATSNAQSVVLMPSNLWHSMPSWRVGEGGSHAHKKRCPYSEVLREGLRLVERRESEDELRLAALRDAAKVGIADIEAGNFCNFDSAEVHDQYLEKLTSELIGE